MLVIDVGNTFRTGSRTGIQRVVRQLAYGLKTGDESGTRLVVYDVADGGYFELGEAQSLRRAGGLDDISPEDRRAFDLAGLGPRDIFLDIDSAWNEPLDRGSLYRFLKRRGAILVTLHYDAIPVLFPEYCHPDTVVRFAEHLAQQLHYSDYVLTISSRVDRDLKELARRLLGRSVTSEVIPLGADFAAAPPMSDAEFRAAFPELEGLRFMLGVGTVEPRKNHALLFDMLDRLEAPDASLVIVGRTGWMAEGLLARLHAHPEFGKRLFWHEGLADLALRSLYARAFVSVFPSSYEGYGLPPVEALAQGGAAVASDAGSLPEVVGGYAELFPSGDADALFAILDRLYRDPAQHRRLREMASAYVAPSWSGATARMRSVLDDVVSGASHDLASPARQMVFLAVHPERLELSLRSVWENLPFIDRIVVLTKPEARAAIEGVVAQHFAHHVVLTDDEIAGAAVPADHQARNTWLRKQLYAHAAIEPNFIASDEDSLALRPITLAHYQNGAVHTGYYFLEDMGTWLASSPTTTSFDRGLRSTWAALREAGYKARAFSSHMPQIVNKSLCTQIFDRFVIDADGPALDEWSLYFNVAHRLYPSHFVFEPYATLGWPMRIGDWFPQTMPERPAFENYYPDNYDAAVGGMFADLNPLGDCAAKASRYFAALERARVIEVEGDGTERPDQLALIVTPTGLRFVGSGAVIAGRRNVRRILLLNGLPDADAVTGRLEMFLADGRGAVVRGETVALSEVCWLPLLPPEQPGPYELSFFATLDDGARLETRAPLTVIADAAHG
jgi:glycosyltransferase involved in cell wall biosynthesis